jgi:hypothetical protein
MKTNPEIDKIWLKPIGKVKRKAYQQKKLSENLIIGLIELNLNET